MYILQWNNDQSGTWFEVDDHNQLLSHAPLTDLTQCPQIDSDARLIVLLPGQLVRMMPLTVPKMRAAERSRAIPFLIEEQLACDPAQIDIAQGNTNAAGQLTLAIFDKAHFVTKLSLLHEHHLKPDVMMPDYLALRWEEKTWTLCPFSETTLVRTGMQSGFTVDTRNLALMLKMMLDKATQEGTLPDKIICYQQDSMIDLAPLRALDLNILFHEVPDQGVFDIAALRSAPALNLLQGPYRPRHKLSAQKRNWWIATSMIALWMILLVGGRITQWIYFSHQENQVSAQVLTAYQSIFPGAESVLEPRFRVSAMLNKLKEMQQSDTFFRMLAAAGKVLNRYPTVEIQQISFQDKALTLQITGQNVTTLSQVSAAMRQLGLRVDQHTNESKDNLVGATLTIQE